MIVADDVDVSRRRLIAAVVFAALPAIAETNDDAAAELAERLTGRMPMSSDRIRLMMPRVLVET